MNKYDKYLVKTINNVFIKNLFYIINFKYKMF